MFATQLNLYHNSQINEIHNAGGTDCNGLCVMPRMASEKGRKTPTKKKHWKKNVKRHEKPNDDTHGLTNSSMNILNNFFPSFIFRFSVFGLFWQWENYDQTPYRAKRQRCYLIAPSILSNRLFCGGRSMVSVGFCWFIVLLLPLIFMILLKFFIFIDLIHRANDDTNDIFAVVANIRRYIYVYGAL